MRVVRSHDLHLPAQSEPSDSLILVGPSACSVFHADHHTNVQPWPPLSISVSRATNKRYTRQRSSVPDPGVQPSDSGILRSFSTTLYMVTASHRVRFSLPNCYQGKNR